MPSLQAWVLWLHLLAAVAWIGGAIFLSAIVLPVLRQAMPSAERLALVSQIGRRFRVLGWIAIVVLILTGLHQTAWLLPGASPRYAAVLGVKLGLVAVLVLLSAIHDWWLGPRLVALAAAGRTDQPAYQRLQRLTVRLAQLQLVLGLLVLLAAATLRMG